MQESIKNNLKQVHASGERLLRAADYCMFMQESIKNSLKQVHASGERLLRAADYCTVY